MDSVLALLKVVALLVRASAGGMSEETLHNAIVAQLVLHQACYNLSLWKPKHHYAMHIARCMVLQGILLSCFVMERKHRVAKRFMQLYSRHTFFEKKALWRRSLLGTCP